MCVWCVSQEIKEVRVNTNTVCQTELFLKSRFVPRSKHTPSVIKTSQLMMYKEIIAVCSEINTKHINTVWAERRIAEC